MRVHYEQECVRTKDVRVGPGGWVATSDDFELVAQGKTKNEAVLALVSLVHSQFLCEEDCFQRYGELRSILKLNVPLDQEEDTLEHGHEEFEKHVRNWVSPKT